MARRADARQIHATAVAIGGTAVLLRGPSGSGKSDLALRLIHAGAMLVADDRCDLSVASGRLFVSAPAAIRGLIEVRGLGIVPMRHRAKAPVSLVIDLVKPDVVERLPSARRCRLATVTLPLLRLTPFEASAAAKVMLAVRSVAKGVVSAR